MIKGLHGISLNYSNVVTQARIAHETGYGALELLPEHLLRYLEHGGTTSEYNQITQKNHVKVGCINALQGMGRYQNGEREEMLAEAERLCRIAQELHCPTIQILALHELDALPEEQMMDILVQNVRAIAELGKRYGGIRFQIELVSYTKFNHISQGLEVIKRVGMDNVGLLLDFWHFTVAGIDTPQTVAALDPKMIYGVHFCDGIRPKNGQPWDEQVLRNYMVGEGEVDIQQWTDAIKSTGYNGMWSSELVSPDNWEKDLKENAQKCSDIMDQYIGTDWE